MLQCNNRVQDVVVMGEGGQPFSLPPECAKAAQSLRQESVFLPADDQNGPYRLNLSFRDKRLIFQIENADGESLPALVLSLGPYRTLLRDYAMMIESYEGARIEGNCAKLEAIDMGRRGLHNEAAEKMMDRLADKITMDLETARKIFTLVFCLTHKTL